MNLLSNQHGQGEQLRCNELTHIEVSNEPSQHFARGLTMFYDQNYAHFNNAVASNSLILFDDCLLPVLKPH